ncbi:MAG: C40 family peptidase [Paludibacter sp.]|nr:C40 family peptidase [Paludibacter sp.]
MNGIITLPLIPLRAGESDLSEMTSQLLFGERVEIIESKDNWLFIKNSSDNYTGWVNRKMVKLLSVKQEQSLTDITPYCVSRPILVCQNSANQDIYLPGGSLLPGYKNGKCTIGNEVFTVNSDEETFSEKIDGEKLATIAKQYLNAPYLWGGKSILGIDSSGLVQVVYSIGGILLPRDAAKQVDSGTVIDFISEAKAGDLAFFENAEGNIIHVGILLNQNQIIHSSGCVHIETIDSQGIISSETGKYTHKLRVIKRLV